MNFLMQLFDISKPVIQPAISIAATLFALITIAKKIKISLTKNNLATQLESNEGRKRLAEKLESIKKRTYSNNEKNKISFLEKIDGCVGVRFFSYKLYKFTTSVAFIYPITLAFLTWIATGSNSDLISGFLPENKHANTDIVFLGITSDLQNRLFFFCLFIGIGVFAWQKTKTSLTSSENYISKVGWEGVKQWCKDWLVKDILRYFMLAIMIIFEQSFVAILFANILFVIFLNRDFSITIGNDLAVAVSRVILVMVLYMFFSSTMSPNTMAGKFFVIVGSFLFYGAFELFVFKFIIEKWIERSIVRNYIACAINCIIIYYFLSYNVTDETFYMFSLIPSALLFFLVFPIINSVFDYVSINTTRIFIKKGIIREGEGVKWFMIDVFFAMLYLMLLAVTLTLCLHFINLLFESFYPGFIAVDMDEIIDLLRSNPLNPKIWWLYIMLLSTAIPTIYHIAFFLYNISRSISRIPEEKIENLIRRIRNFDTEDSDNNLAINIRKVFISVRSVNILTYLIVGLIILSFTGIVVPLVLGKLHDSVVFILQWAKML